MQLFDALRLTPDARPALVGAGGKTTSLFQLARQALAAGGPAAWVTVSTHLSVEQAVLADRHVILTSPDDLEPIDPAALAGLTLFTGPVVEGGRRLSSLPRPVLDALDALARAQGIFLGLEADGSRCLPLKAPAPHEPALPAWANPVIVVAGLSGLGAPLDDEHVHRAERFGRLSGLTPGAPVTPEALAAVLAHSEGGLKYIPSTAWRAALLNQADTPGLQAAAHAIAARLLPAYQAVLIAALHPPLPSGPSPRRGEGDEDVEPRSSPTSSSESFSLPLEGGAGGVLAVHEPIAGVILAAGRASRMGQVKQALPWRGQPLVRHAAQTALAAGLWPVVVVTGFAAPEVTQALDGLPVQVVYNPEWEAGQSASLRAGLLALPPHTGGVVFLLADQPHTPAALVRGLVEAHASGLPAIVAPLIGGQRSNPVLFDRRTFSDLLALQGDTGGRALFARYRPVWLPWLDEQAAQDVDTPEDYQRLLNEAD